MTTPNNKPTRYWGKAIASFFIVLCTMPLGHAVMKIMEHTMSETAIHYAGFAIGLVGFIMVIIGVFRKGDTAQTFWGFFGALLFWTGWVEFLFMYYANRFGTHAVIDPLTGKVTKPEYLILPASFGFWMAYMTVYLFCTRTGCNFINWWQKVLFREKRKVIAAHPMTRHTSIVTFMQFTMMIWAMYLLLMFCYDENFLGVRHPLTIIVGIGFFLGSFYIFAKQLRLATWGANIRMAVATVLVFWTPVEIAGRMNLFKEIWLEPKQHATEMVVIGSVFLVLLVYIIYANVKKKK